MINIMIPCCGLTEAFKGSRCPKNLYMINGKPMLQYIIENYKDIGDKRFIFLLLKEECDVFHTDSIVRLLAQDTPVEVIILKNNTGGALCTSLMAIDYINNEEPLVISYGDQLIISDFSRIFWTFAVNQYDGAVICFDSTHPHWTYARINKKRVVEVVKKSPVSRNAIAGFYYYRYGSDFVKAAKKAILKGADYDGHYYLLASINEMILNNKYIGYYRIDPDNYKSFYSLEKIKEFETSGVTRSNN